MNLKSFKVVLKSEQAWSQPGKRKEHRGFIYAPNQCKLLFMPQKHCRASGVISVQVGP